MPSGPERVADPDRLAALLATGLLDTEAEDAFDRLTQLTAELLHSPVALVSFVDAERQFFKSQVGLGEPWASRRGTPLSHSFCQHVVSSGEPLVVTDARESPLLRENPAVDELGVIAYAGVPLEVQGQPIGAFCVIDRKPRTWTSDELRLLRELGRAVEAQIATRVATKALVERQALLDTVLSTMPAGVLLRDVGGRVLRSNRAIERLLGRSAEVLLETDFWAITHPDDLAGDAESRVELLRGDRRIVTRIKRFLHADGHYLWARVSASVLKDADGNIYGTVAVVEDVTGEQQAEEAIVRQARIYHTIARSIPRGAVLLYDREFRCLAADGAELLASIGLERDELEGRTVIEIVSADNRDRMEELYRQAFSGISAENETTRNGRTLLTRVAPVWDDDSISGGIALIQDVTEERAQAASVERAKALFEATITNVRDGVVVLDQEHRVLYANRAYAELLDFEWDKLVGSTREEFLAHVTPRVADPKAFGEAVAEPVPPEGTSAEFTLIVPSIKHVRRSVTPIELPDAPGLMAIWQDISAEKLLLEDQARQALTDALTGIPNRRAAEVELVKAMALAQRGATPLSLALFDVDHFKGVNDKHGHAAGDEVLRRVAGTLDAAKRLTDTVARWGGEEFLAVLPVSLDGAVTFCERARQEVERLVCPGVGHVTVSAGVASLTSGEAVAAVLARADACLYAAKRGGRNRVVSSLEPEHG